MRRINESYVSIGSIYEAGYIMAQGIPCIAVEKQNDGDHNIYVFEDTEDLQNTHAAYNGQRVTDFMSLSCRHISGTSYQPVFSVYLAGFLMCCGVPLHHIAEHDRKIGATVYYFVQSERFEKAMEKYRAMVYVDNSTKYQFAFSNTFAV